MSEELSVEWGHHNAFAILRLVGRNAPKEMSKVVGVIPRSARGCIGVIGLLLAQVNTGASHPPQLESARPAHLMKLEIPLIAGISLESTPDLHRCTRIADVRRHRPMSNPVRPIGRTQRLHGNTRCGCPVHDGITSWISGEAERAPSRSQVCVDEEEVIPCVGEVLLDPASHSGAWCGGPWLPGSSRPVGTFWQPAASRRTAEDPAMLGYANCKLKTNTLVARQQW